MSTPNINWIRVAAALSATSPFGPLFAPDGAIYGPDGSTLVPPADETVSRNTDRSAQELGPTTNRTWRPWGRTRFPRTAPSRGYRSRLA